MKIENKIKKERTVSSGSITFGTVFQGELEDVGFGIYLATQSGLLKLDDHNKNGYLPCEVWNWKKGKSETDYKEILNYRPLNATLVIESYAD